MKKFLALVLTLAMVLTLNVGMIASAAGTHVDTAGKTTVTVEGVEYQVITDLNAVSTKGNYILGSDVAVAANATITFAAGTVLNGNGYTITVAGNDYTAPLSAAPFVLAYGDLITITNVNFGSVDAPICFASVEPEVEGAKAANLSIFEEAELTDEEVALLPEGEEEPRVIANFIDVNFNAYAADILSVHVAAVLALAQGDITFDGCNVFCNLETANVASDDARGRVAGYVGGFIGRVRTAGTATFTNCTTVAGSKIVADYRTGGFVGGVSGGIQMQGCTNNAVVESFTLIAGGFMGYVEGETLSAWLLDSCVNNANITAYIAPDTVVQEEDGVNADGSIKYKETKYTQGDNGRSAGALVAYIYKDEDATAPRIVVSNCTNNGNIYGEDRLSGLMGDNRVAYGAKYTDDEGNTKYESGKCPIIENCVNTGDVVCTVRDALSGAHVLGGMTSRSQGGMIFRNSINYGRVDANGMNDGHLGGFMGNTSAGAAKAEQSGEPVSFINCINYGTIANGRRIGGISGTVEAICVFTGCVNYGSIISGTSTRADNYAAGIAGFADNYLSTWEGCANFGSINATHRAGGILGSFRANNNAAGVINGCFNFADVTCIDGPAGGIVGVSQCDITITNCLNAGVVDSITYMVAGQIIANAEKAVTMGDNMVFGTIPATIMETFPPVLDGIAGNEFAKEVALAEGATALAVVIGDAAALEDARNVAVTAEAALAALQEVFGGEAPLYVIDGAIACIEPDIRGVQLANEVKDGKVDVRFIGIVNNDMTYETVSFTYKIAGKETTAKATGMENIIGTNMCGEVETRDAAAFGGKALYAVVIPGVATTGTVEIEITMTATSNGVAYTTQTAHVTIVDGVVVA